MVFRAMDDGMGLIGKRRQRRAMFGVLAIIGALSVATASVSAQQGGSGFHAKVLEFSGNADRVSVPLRGSVVVETSADVARADVVAEQVADIQILSPKRLLITGQGYGRTTILLTSSNNQQHQLNISVELDLSLLNETILKIDPLSHAAARSVLGNIVLTGTVSSAERAVRISEMATLFLPPPGQGETQRAVQNHLDVAGEQQVALHVIVAEVSRSATRELGVNGFLAGDNFRDGFLVNQIAGINPINIGAAAGALVTGDIPFVTDTNGIPIRSSSTLSVGFPRVQTQLFIKAMADNSLLKVLAEPTLTAISGETATFLAGGEFPIPIPQSLGTVTIEFREFGVRMNFTPIVRGNELIRLRVAPEVSELDFTSAAQFEGFVIPGLNKRSMETTIEVSSGETIAIAGLLSEQVRALASRVPAVGEIPILGSLFRSVNYRKSLTELVILVRPELVAPLDAHQNPGLPTDGIGDPSDRELYGLALLESETPRAADAPDQTGPAVDSAPHQSTVHGPWGHETSDVNDSK